MAKLQAHLGSLFPGWHVPVITGVAGPAEKRPLIHLSDHFIAGTASGSQQWEPGTGGSAHNKKVKQTGPLQTL